jgi:hypothetical protein
MNGRKTRKVYCCILITYKYHTFTLMTVRVWSENVGLGGIKPDGRLIKRRSSLVKVNLKAKLSKRVETENQATIHIKII